MKQSRSTYSVLPVLVVLLALIACKRPAPAGEEPPSTDGTSEVDSRGFNPLELPADREVVPRKQPQHGVIAGSGVVDDVVPATTEDTSGIGDVPQDMDTLNNQAYRVQLFTSKVYGEARRAVRVAEEIFDQPVYVDYEVPYYKVRVGSFADRDAAESYQQKARSAGYQNAWVVIVSLSVRETRPLYDDLPTATPEEPATDDADPPVGVDQVDDG